MSEIESKPGDLLAGLVDRVLSGGRRRLARFAEAGRERLELRQLEKDRDAFWIRLGRTSYHLVEGGEIDHPALRRAMERIDEIEARIGEARDPRP